ncbi:MAG: exosortase system-associated protein, TIGR04073 family [Candidatus Omnitrophica bacterium]|nr:exosortase system-associated protein, TIGR04073 family [Candidatus Omnitrophota bacterium]
MRRTLLLACLIWAGIVPAAQASIYDRFMRGEPVLTRRRVTAPSPYAGWFSTPIDKWSGGMANVLTGPLELPVTIYNVGRSDGWLLGGTKGLAVGLWRGLVRIVGGAIDAVTCLTPPYHHHWLEPPLLFGSQSPITDAEVR